MTMATPAQWRKSSHSPDEANCVELAAVWRKSTRGPNQSDCIEVAIANHTGGSCP
jgi:hypothetical protein